MTSDKPFTIGFQYGAGAGATATSQAPIDADKAFDDAQALIEAGKIEEAETLCRQVVDAEPHHARAWHVLGFAALQKGQRDAALKTLERSFELGNDNPLMFMHLGIARAAHQDFAGSVNAFEQAVQGEPRLAPAHYNMALSLKRLDRLAEAEAALRKTLELTPENADAWCELGVVMWARQRDNADLLDAFEHALAIDPDHIGALNQKGLLLHALERGEEAVALLQKAIGLAPKRPELHVNLGDLLADGNGEAAVAAYRAALELAPGFPGAEAKLAAAEQRLRPAGEAVH